MDNMNLENNQVQNTEGSNGMAIASLVLGILSIVMTCCITYVGLVCGILGIVFAVLANKKGKTKMATAGMICSIIGVILAVVFIIIAAVYGTALTAALTESLGM